MLSDLNPSTEMTGQQCKGLSFQLTLNGINA